MIPHALDISGIQAIREALERIKRREEALRELRLGHFRWIFKGTLWPNGSLSWQIPL